MLRIAKGDYAWPSPPSSSKATDPPAVVALAATGLAPGNSRLVDESSRRLVDRLLTREPQKRGVVGSLGLDGEWGHREVEGDWPPSSGR